MVVFPKNCLVIPVLGRFAPELELLTSRRVLLHGGSTPESGLIDQLLGKRRGEHGVATGSSSLTPGLCGSCFADHLPLNVFVSTHRILIALLLSSLAEMLENV